MLGGDSVPGVFHTSLLNLFWPVSSNTLPAGPLFDFYEGRFALQAGLVPSSGFVLAMGTLLAQPRLAWSRRIVLPLLLFVVNAMLIMGWLWEVLPGPLRFVQFAYRLIGVMHLLGFVLIMQTLECPEHVLRRLPPRIQRGIAAAFIMLAFLGARTYWYEPEVSSTPSANLAASDLGNNDNCSLCPVPRQGTLPLGVIPSEIPHDTWTRLAFGGATIDASSLKDDYYLMPAYDYTFVRVTDENGALVRTSSLDRRVVVEHTDTIAYDLQPEMLALSAGAVLFLLYAVLGMVRARSEPGVRRASAA
jgi:hypothetical protein